ncbi:MAG: hypothetical protein J6J24_00170, partial [Clostridia bacterium]|nr:hypothetical protein [Clostridia bacterium]
GLSYYYAETFGSSSDLRITTSLHGQTFNLGISTTSGGYGNLYLMPNDMIKIVDGVQSLLVYKYELDANGELVENALFVPLHEIDFKFADIINGQSYESLMAGEDSTSYAYSNFFLNNDGEAIAYSDVFLKIKIVIADGLSENTAIRIYNAEDLSAIDYAKYYKIMNNITFSGWESLDSREFSGMLFGNHSDITLTFEDGSENFVDVVSDDGVIKDLVFAGEVAVDVANDKVASGFIANVNNGTISNVSVDVYYDNANDIYKSSKIVDSRPSVNVGALVGANYGLVENAFAYGVSVEAINSKYIGGLVGYNEGTVSGSGVEFYTFKSEVGGTEFNKLNGNVAETIYGGIVGFATASSVIDKSYAYAYSLVNDGDSNKIFGSTSVGAFAGTVENEAVIRESFAFVGNIQRPFFTKNSGEYGRIVNSYYSSYAGEFVSEVCKDAYYTSAVGSTGAYSPSSAGQYKKLTSYDKNVTSLLLDSTIWQLDDVDENVNFGFVHLKNVYQSTQVETSHLNLKDVVDGTKTQLLIARDDAGAVTESGVMFVYDPVVNVVAGSAEDSELLSYNTIRLVDMFESITEKQSRSLLLTSTARNLLINSTSVQLLEENLQIFTIKVHSKMDFTNAKEFSFVVMNALPRLQTTVDAYQIVDGQTILLQQGKSRSVVYNTINSIYLNGNAYALEKNSYEIEYVHNEWQDDGSKIVIDQTNQEERAMSVAISNNSLVFKGIRSHSGNAFAEIESNVCVEEITNMLTDDLKTADIDAYNFYSYVENSIESHLSRDYRLSVFEGATGLTIKDATSLEVKPSQYAVFNVEMETDNVQDNIVVGLRYGEIEVDADVEQNETTSKLVFEVDDKLSMQFTWTKTYNGGKNYSYRVVVKILDDNRHLVDKNYDNLQIMVNALSQQNNEEYLKTVVLKVRPEEIEDASFTTYSVGSRQIKNSVLYIKHSNMILNTLIPSSDAIVALAISPQYAKVSHFRLTYKIEGEGEKGTISLSKLKHNSIYGYYVDSRDVSFLANGLEVEITEDDKKNGNGMFYFRIYVSSAFKSNSKIKLFVEFFDGETLVEGKTVSHELKIDYMQEATVKVNGVSTYLLAKGESATISINVAKDQILYDLHLQNNASGITLSSWIKQETENGFTYTATLNANVNAKVLDENKAAVGSGVFYVCASVERIINNEQEIKESRATVCLVDFSLNGNEISLQGSTKQEVYNGKSYDVFRSYVGSTEELIFDYPLMPVEYNYDANDSDEAAAVEALKTERAKFLLNHNYKNEEIGYYINHRYIEERGIYEEMSLKQLLWLAANEEESSTIWNENYGIFAQNSYFLMDTTQVVGAGGATHEAIRIT